MRIDDKEDNELTEQEKELWLAGFYHGCDNHPVTDNPHRSDTWEFSMWLDGCKDGLMTVEKPE